MTDLEILDYAFKHRVEHWYCYDLRDGVLVRAISVNQRCTVNFGRAMLEKGAADALTAPPREGES